jgi:hypothetical protein
MTNLRVTQVTPHVTCNLQMTQSAAQQLSAIGRSNTAEVAK